MTDAINRYNNQPVFASVTGGDPITFAMVEANLNTLRPPGVTAAAIRTYSLNLLIFTTLVPIIMTRLIFALCVICAINSCSLFDKDTCTDEQTFQFNIPCQLSPRLDTFHIGDTFWISSQVSHLLYDSVSDSVYFFGDDQHQFFIEFYLLNDSTASTVTSSDNFMPVNVLGSAQIGTFAISRLFRMYYDQHSTGIDSFLCGFIPQRKGAYSMFFSPNSFYYIDGGARSLTDGCIEYKYFDFDLDNRDPDINFELYEPFAQGFTKEKVMKAGAYMFVVVE
jgi:hypothetical protein